MANLFNMKFEDITFEDIEEMVDAEVQESFVLDYKERFDTEQTEKLICAMANTYGGFIVYGVKCDRDNNRPTAIKSIAADRKLDDRVDSISTFNLTPPVFCNCRYLTSKSSKGQVFVVRVPESDRTPHAANNNRDVWVKVAGQKRNYDRADMSRLEWLREKRNAYVEVRDRLLNDSHGHRILLADKPGRLEYTIGATVYPLYPKDRLIEYHELRAYLEKQMLVFARRHDTPVTLRHAVHVDHGLCAYFDLRLYNITVRYFFEFNAHGLSSMVFYVEKEGEPENHQVYVPLHHTTTMLHMAVDSGMLILDALGFDGVRRVDMEIENIKDTRITSEVKGYGTLRTLTDGKNVAQDSVRQSFDIMVGESEAKLQFHITDFVGRIVHLYGAYDDAYLCASSLATAEFRRINRPAIAE